MEISRKDMIFIAAVLGRVDYPTCIDLYQKFHDELSVTEKHTSEEWYKVITFSPTKIERLRNAK